MVYSGEKSSVIQIWTLLESTKHSFITQDKNEYLR